MGFWAPRTLVMDARRHGVTVLGPDINSSEAQATLEWLDGAASPAVRVGIEYVRTIGKDLAKEIAGGRPYKDMEALARRCRMSAAQMEALATAGTFGCFGMSRREALWAAGVYAAAREDQLVTVTDGAQAPPLPEMAPIEQASADLWSTGLSPDASPMQFVRPALERRGILTAAGLETARNGSVVKVAGIVTHRQRPATAQGTTFVSLEDETGLINVICNQGVWDRYRKVARSSKALLVTGRLERAEGVINLSAQKLETLTLSMNDHVKARDFR